MYPSTLKPVTCWVPLSNPNASKATLLNRQALPAAKVQTRSMKEREQPLLQEASAVSSRREIMQLAAVSLCFPSLFFPATAEARPGEPTMTQKITGKVEELKEKAGSSMPKLGELKEKAGSALPKPGELKEKAGSALPKPGELKEKAGSALPKPGELKEKAGMANGKVQEFKEKAGSSLPKPGDLKEKAGSSMSKFGELKDKAGSSLPKPEELKEKAGLSMPKDEGKGPEPIYNKGKKSKATNELYGSKATSIDGVAGTIPGDASLQTPVQASQKEPSVPHLSIS